MPTFVRFTYKSITEAKNRALTIALMTCDYLKSATHFVKMFNEHQLKEEPKDCISEIRKFSEIKTQDPDQSLIDFYPLQPHNGLIMKRKDPYLTILRARPRNIKRNRERLYALEGADEKMIEERIE